ncbi:MAG: hypothetical protein GY827_12705 [Cytophagales bacterium]|nr:hypothetical protein [Cytophagales bacterium]
MTQKLLFRFQIGLIFSLVVGIIIHLATFLYINLGMLFIITGPLTFLGFGLGVILAQKLTDGQKKPKLSDLLAFLPKKYFFVVPVLMVYTGFNFFYVLGNHKKGGLSADYRDGKYVLQYRGEIREIITKEEYSRQQCYDTRLFSGHSLPFQYIAIVFLMAYKEKRRREISESDKYSVN